MTPTEMKQAEFIVSKCGGLPKVIAAIGELCKSDNRFLEYLTDNFMGKLETEPKFHSLRSLFTWMQSYFDACSDSIKPCIFYLSIFSADQNIKWRRLLRRWIAEGYARDTTISTAEENGENFFSELVKLSIIHQPNGKALCQVNGFFHEYIRSRPIEDNLVFELEGRCSMNSQRAGQHLTIRSSWDRDKTVFESIDFSRLRSLTVYGKWMPFFISSNISMRLLRVLDLEDTTGLTNDDLEHIGKLVPRLKFLSLRGCREITHLPDSVGDLRQLQTLDVRHTSIFNLPQDIIKLLKLRYIRAGTTKPWDEGGMVTSLPTADGDRTATAAEDGDRSSSGQLAATTPSGNRPHTLISGWLSKFCSRRHLNSVSVKVPAETGKLTALHTLGVINVRGAGRKAILTELEHLTQLRRLGVSGIIRETVQELFSAISDHGHLESLYVRFDKDKQSSFVTLDDRISQPPKTLECLKLHGHVHILPGLIKLFKNLTKADLEITTLKQEDFHVLDELPNSHVLRRLCVKPIQDGELQLSTPRNPNMDFKVLEIHCSSNLKVTFGGCVPHSVEVLKIHCSAGSCLQLCRLSDVQVYLKEVWLKGSYGDEMKQFLERELRYLEKKPVLKLVQARSS